MKNIIIALDGPAGSGKTTTARLVAGELNYIYIDTGAMYRAITLECIRRKIDINETAVSELIKTTQVSLKPSENGQITLLNGEDVSRDIRLTEVTKLVSPVSAMACVRDLMVAQQRELGCKGGVVMDGRDIGTVVFPQAELKVYLIASIDSRAERRYKEMIEKEMPADLNDIKEQISARDKYDSTREISPLRKADDAVLLDTSLMSIDDQVKSVLDLAYKLIR